jgi:hypothetical protein
MDGIKKIFFKIRGAGYPVVKKVPGDLVLLPEGDHCTIADACSSNGFVLMASEKRYGYFFFW